MKKMFLFTSLLIFFALSAINAKSALAGSHLYFSPSSGTYSVDEEFSVTVKMDSGSQVVGGADGVGTYDSSILELVSLEKAPSLVFSSTDDGGSCSISDHTSGKFSFSCYSNSNSSSNSDSGDLVVFKFKGKAVGTGVARFTCAQDSTTDSNIIKTDPVGDIIICGENVDGTYVIKARSESTPTTPTPSTTTTTTTTTTETESKELPKTGAIGTTLGLVLFGAVSVFSAIFLRFL